MISVYPADSPYLVYCNECWWKDFWDPLEYGRDFDFNRPFFEQFHELELAVPHFALFQEGENINCQYTNYGIGNKSCYLAMCAYAEDVMFSHGAIQAKSCMDCEKIVGCELCYDCIDCAKCYNTLFLKECTNCSDSSFLQDCVGCRNCFCCSALRNKKYYWFNEKLTKEEYEKRLSEVKFTNQSIQEWKEKRDKLALKYPKRYIHGHGSESVTGDYIDNCKSLKHCFDMINEVEDCAYCDFCGYQMKDCYDCTYAGIGSTLSYEINGTTYSNNCKFLYYTRENSDCEYLQHCFNNKHLFGCFGLNRQEYCILNKQYTPDQYHELRTRIIEHMKSTGEYGEFFPISISPVPYNESIAQDHYPMTKEQVLAKGWQWRDQKKKQAQSGTIECKNCQGHFKVIKQEQSFYRHFKLPIPELCPECRHQIRSKQRNPFQLHDRQCQKCQKQLETAYSPERPETIYCNECYLEEAV